jgi:hypothetical protein
MTLKASMDQKKGWEHPNMAMAIIHIVYLQLEQSKSKKHANNTCFQRLKSKNHIIDHVCAIYLQTTP